MGWGGGLLVHPTCILTLAFAALHAGRRLCLGIVMWETFTTASLISHHLRLSLHLGFLLSWLQGDAYAFGIVMWETFTGASPYPAMAHPQIMVAVVTHDMRPRFPDVCPEWYKVRGAGQGATGGTEGVREVMGCQLAHDMRPRFP